MKKLILILALAVTLLLGLANPAPAAAEGAIKPANACVCRKGWLLRQDRYGWYCRSPEGLRTYRLNCRPSVGCRLKYDLLYNGNCN